MGEETELFSSDSVDCVEVRADVIERNKNVLQSAASDEAPDPACITTTLGAMTKLENMVANFYNLNLTKSN